MSEQEEIIEHTRNAFAGDDCLYAALCVFAGFKWPEGRAKLSDAFMGGLKMNAQEAIEKMRADLAWRGPNDRVMGIICVPRAGAEALLQMLEPPRSPLDTINAIMQLAMSLTREEILQVAEEMKHDAASSDV
jgi:hypothetical protein